MTLTPIGLDIDGSIRQQKELYSRLTDSADLRAEEKNLRLWANSQGLKQLRQTIHSLRQKHPDPWLTFIGSGDLHHITLSLLESLPEKLGPVTFVLIDHHPDWFTRPPRNHCGNWVSGIPKIKRVQSIILAGQDSDDLKPKNFWSFPFRELCTGRIQLFPYKRKPIRAFMRWPARVASAEKIVRRFYGTDLYFETLMQSSPDIFFSNLADRLKGQTLYISIDKDCLEKKSALTDWEQGQIALKDLITGINKLKQVCPVAGVDICGDQAPSPLKGLLQRIDSGRIFPNITTKESVNSINETTNLELLDTFLKEPV